MSNGLQLEEAEQNGLISQMVKVAMDAGVEINDQNAAALAQVARKSIETMHQKRIIELVAKDVAAKVAEKYLKANAGSGLPPSGSAPPAPPTPKVERPKGYY